MAFYVYKLVNIRFPDETRYIGSTTNPKFRFEQHKYAACYSKQDLHRWMIDNISYIRMIVIQECNNRTEMLALETKLIKETKGLFNVNNYVGRTFKYDILKEYPNEILKEIEAIVDKPIKSEKPLSRSKHYIKYVPKKNIRRVRVYQNGTKRSYK